MKLFGLTLAQKTEIQAEKEYLMDHTGMTAEQVRAHRQNYDDMVANMRYGDFLKNPPPKFLDWLEKEGVQ